VPEAADPFALLGVPASYALDAAVLRSALLRGSAESHPDRFAMAPEAERIAAETRMTTLNAAFRTLSDPLRRAEALLRRTGADTADRSAPPDFLMEMLELREAVEGGDTTAADTLRDREAAAMDGLAEDFAAWEAAGMPDDGAAPLVDRLLEATYLQRLRSEANRAPGATTRDTRD